LKIAICIVLAIHFMTDISAAQTTPENFYQLSAQDIEGKQVSLAEYKGKVALVVNTASQCGFTSQYKGMESLYQEYKDRGLVVLAFPSNDFAGQEPGSNSDIKKFCELKYNTTFPIFSKAPVTGADKQPVFKFLTEKSAADYQGDPGWNFVKFLIDKNGQVVGRFSSMTSPDGGKIKRAIEEVLADSPQS